MSILQQDDSSLDITLGQVLRLPCKFIQGKSSADKALIKSISQQLQDTGKNILPVIVKALDEDDYQAVLNTQILDAARLAKLDFIWCIIVNDQMQTQVQIESGQLPPQINVATINVVTASEREITEFLEHIKIQKKGFSTIKSKVAAKAIVRQRRTKKLSSLSFLTKEQCGVGKATLPRLSEFLVVK